MIEIRIRLEDGLLKTCFIRGHADAGPKGKDIVCAAVSVLAGTAERTLSVRKGVKVRADAPKRGEFFLEVRADEGEKPFLSGVTAFFVEGLESVAREYPKNCRLNYES